jgi:hypothetical protein
MCLLGRPILLFHLGANIPAASCHHRFAGTPPPKENQAHDPAIRCDAVFLIANRSKRTPMSLQSLEPSLKSLLQIIRNRKK